MFAAFISSGEYDFFKINERLDALGIHLKDVLECIKLGRMEKRGRGVCRIAHYLPTEYDTYAEAVALVGETARICGESVLAMHNLALVNPARVHVAVRRRLRKELPGLFRTGVANAVRNMRFGTACRTPCAGTPCHVRAEFGKIRTKNPRRG